MTLNQHANVNESWAILHDNPCLQINENVEEEEEEDFSLQMALQGSHPPTSNGMQQQTSEPKNKTTESVPLSFNCTKTNSCSNNICKASCATSATHSSSQSSSSIPAVSRKDRLPPMPALIPIHPPSNSSYSDSEISKYKCGNSAAIDKRQFEAKSGMDLIRSSVKASDSSEPECIRIMNKVYVLANSINRVLKEIMNSKCIDNLLEYHSLIFDEIWLSYSLDASRITGSVTNLFVLNTEFIKRIYDTALSLLNKLTQLKSTDMPQGTKRTRQEDSQENAHKLDWLPQLDMDRWVFYSNRLASLKRKAKRSPPSNSIDEPQSKKARVTGQNPNVNSSGSIETAFTHDVRNAGTSPKKGVENTQSVRLSGPKTDSGHGGRAMAQHGICNERTREIRKPVLPKIVRRCPSEVDSAKVSMNHVPNILSKSKRPVSLTPPLQSNSVNSTKPGNFGLQDPTKSESGVSSKLHHHLPPVPPLVSGVASKKPGNPHVQAQVKLDSDPLSKSKQSSTQTAPLNQDCLDPPPKPGYTYVQDQFKSMCKLGTGLNAKLIKELSEKSGLSSAMVRRLYSAYLVKSMRQKRDEVRKNVESSVIRCKEIYT